MSHKRILLPILLAAGAVGLNPIATAAEAPSLSIVEKVEWQPIIAQVRRLIEAADYLGSPFSPADKQALEKAMNGLGGAQATEAIQRILDAYCLLGVTITPEPGVKVSAGRAKPELVQQGWRQFLVKVHNEPGITAELRAVSPNALSLFESGSSITASDRAYRVRGGSPGQLSAADLWLDLQMFNKQPLREQLSGLNLEYRIMQLYSRDAGDRPAKIAFNLAQGTQNIARGTELAMTFQCAAAPEVTFKVLDETKRPTTGSFVIRDQQGRVYPSQAKRLAPDFAFHPQVYRADGEKVRLPAGTYSIEFGRGPEYFIDTTKVEVTGRPKTVSFQLKRWIDPSKLGWWSGDHHIHAAGCAHYTNPTEGVHAPDMMRHCQGEDLKVGCNLTWGPCFDYQKQFFTGKDDKVSQHPYILHYDVEVSGFGSHQSGHLCLLRLKEEIYPGGDSKDHWPTLGLNTLRWAKKQGAVCGPAHSGWGLEARPAGNAPVSSRTSGEVVTLSDELPNYIIPPFNGIGANEYIMDVTHQVPGPDGKLVPAVDFISTADTPYVWELNIWYHTLNVGFRTRVSGETDFPCIYGERVGLGRSYVKLDGKLNYDQWCEGIRQGRNYVGDGKSHLLEFKANDVAMGENGSELRLVKPDTVRLKAKVAALLYEKPNVSLRSSPYHQKPYWDVERARIEGTREVPVEAIVNGYPVARKNIVADGKLQDISFDVKIGRSSWVALRILPSSHTNPIFVLVDGKPVRASRRSAEWCLKSVDQCWSQKERFYKADETEQAKKDYAHAREVYRNLLRECEVD
ncbi:MAG: CehA/McbA family metallohydrolase [Verrucomicrobia bacterium]|nr:CehA/McbA family metallohydrolase [Verrucomicrobiota bacterium]